MLILLLEGAMFILRERKVIALEVKDSHLKLMPFGEPGSKDIVFPEFKMDNIDHGKKTL